MRCESHEKGAVVRRDHVMVAREVSRLRENAMTCAGNRAEARESSDVAWYS